VWQCCADIRQTVTRAAARASLEERRFQPGFRVLTGMNVTMTEKNVSFFVSRLRAQ
jgi:hypothetical protein